MSISLAVALPADGNLENLARGLAWVKSAGLAAVEVSGAAADQGKALRTAAQEAGVQIACLASDLKLNGLGQQEFQNQGIKAVQAAAALGAQAVRVWGLETARGQTRGDATELIGRRLSTLGAIAADQDLPLQVLLENGGGFGCSRHLWMVCEVAEALHGGEHTGLAWDMARGVEQGESPVLAVPTLNRRIRYSRLGALDLQQLAALLREAGGGAEQIRLFLHRMRGIGYAGTVCLGTLTPEMLAGAAAGGPTPEVVAGIELLQEWAGLRAPAEAKPAEAKPAPAAPAVAAKV
ncbi:MAG: TIM barrel protein [Phycisphaerae bacterium]